MFSPCWAPSAAPAVMGCTIGCQAFRRPLGAMTKRVAPIPVPAIIPSLPLAPGFCNPPAGPAGAALGRRSHPVSLQPPQAGDRLCRSAAQAPWHPRRGPGKAASRYPDRAGVHPNGSLAGLVSLAHPMPSGPSTTQHSGAAGRTRNPMNTPLSVPGGDGKTFSRRTPC